MDRAKTSRRLERKLHIACWGMIASTFLLGLFMGIGTSLFIYIALIAH